MERHLEELLRVWPTRFARQHGPLRPVVAKVAHRHVVLTIPRLLRPLFRRRRELLTELGRAAAEATSEFVRRGVGGDARPGIVVSIASAGIGSEAPATRKIVRRKLAKHPSRESVAHPPGPG